MTNQRINILLVDDQNTPRRTLRDALQGILGVVVSDVEGLASAKSQVQAQRFDVALVDYRYNQDGCDDAVGPAIVRALVKRIQGPVIMFSQHFSKEGTAIEQKARAAGAYMTVERDDIYDWTFETFSKIISDYRKRFINDLTLEPDKDIASKAAVEVVGHDSLGVLLKTAFPTAAIAKVRALGGGLSGDYVLEVKWKTDPLSTVENSACMKLSKHGGGLSDEIRGAPKLYESTADVAVSLLALLPEPIDGWHVGFSSMVEGEALRNVLQKALDRERDSLLSSVYSQIIDKQIKSGSNAYARADQTFSFAFCSSAIDAASSIRRLHQELKHGFDLEVVPRVERWLEFAAGRWPFNDGPHFVAVHGDFHAENILVTPSGQIRVIDWARASTMPRAFDAACLYVDMLCRGAGETTSDLWSVDYADNISKEILITRPFVESSAAVPLTSPVLSVLGKLIQHVLQSGVTEQELLEALLFQLCRYMRFPNIPFPRRMLALKIADAAVRRLSP